MGDWEVGSRRMRVDGHVVGVNGVVCVCVTLGFQDEKAGLSLKEDIKHGVILDGWVSC